jgi:hypothetical protein
MYVSLDHRAARTCHPDAATLDASIEVTARREESHFVGPRGSTVSGQH